MDKYLETKLLAWHQLHLQMQAARSTPADEHGDAVVKSPAEILELQRESDSLLDELRAAFKAASRSPRAVEPAACDGERGRLRRGAHATTARRGSALQSTYF